MTETHTSRVSVDGLRAPNTAEAASLYQRLRSQLGVLKLADATQALPAVLDHKMQRRDLNFSANMGPSRAAWVENLLDSSNTTDIVCLMGRPALLSRRHRRVHIACRKSLQFDLRVGFRRFWTEPVF